MFEVMSAVDEMKSAPLLDVEWAEDVVGDASASGTEESLCFVEDEVEAG